MKKVLVAGATGYLGRYAVKEFKKQGYWVRALTRSADRLENLTDGVYPREYADEAFIGEVTDPASLAGVCEGIDIVFSSIGITRQKDNLTYMDVDYQGNKNLLAQAQKSNVSKFVYVSVLNADQMSQLKMIQAKELFVEALTQSGLGYTVIRPTGFYSDMLDYLKMAKSGRGYLFGNGEHKINPIHGTDLAEVCVNAVETDDREINVGGPETFSHKEIMTLAFEALGQKTKITYIPIWLKNILLVLSRTFTSVKTYGPLEFFMTALTMDIVGHPFGNKRLKDYYVENVNTV